MIRDSTSDTYVNLAYLPAHSLANTLSKALRARINGGSKRIGSPASMGKWGKM